LLQVVVALFLQASVAAGVALLVSTFASSTLFTIVVSLMIFLIGHAQALARDVWFPDGVMHSAGARVLAGLVAIIFPDFNQFNIFDGVAAGQEVPGGFIWRLGGLTFLYLAIYTIASWFVFAKKEL
jgi:hypothetical protein